VGTVNEGDKGTRDDKTRGRLRLARFLISSFPPLLLSSLPPRPIIKAGM